MEATADEYIFGDYSYGPDSMPYGYYDAVTAMAFVGPTPGTDNHKDHELWGDDDVIYGGDASFTDPTTRSAYSQHVFAGDGDDEVHLGHAWYGTAAYGQLGDDTVWQADNVY